MADARPICSVPPKNSDGIDLSELGDAVAERDGMKDNGGTTVDVTITDFAPLGDETIAIAASAAPTSQESLPFEVLDVFTEKGDTVMFGASLAVGVEPEIDEFTPAMKTMVDSA